MMGYLKEVVIVGRECHELPMITKNIMHFIISNAKNYHRDENGQTFSICVMYAAVLLNVICINASK